MTLDLPKGPFEVSVQDLSTLDANDAVNVFHQLLVCEAMTCGMPVTSISVPKAITVADGGIDAEVNSLDGADLPAGLLRSGHARYQIKTGKFSASTPSDLKALVLQPKFSSVTSPRPEHLNTRVKACLDSHGTFVVVLFGSDAVGVTEGYGANELKTLLISIDPNYANTTVEIIRANQICAAISTLVPGLALQLNGLGGAYGAPLHSLDFMEQSCDLEVSRYVPTEDLKASVLAITEQANNPNGFKHVRVLGDAGAGKTHLVYLAMSQSELRSIVLYCPEAENLVDSPAFSQLLRLARTGRIILVVDECDVDTATELQARLRRIGSHFLLITIFNQFENDDALGESVQLIEVPALDVDSMAKIFAGYGIPEDRQTWLADLCSGSPRAAHKIGGYILAQPELDYAVHFRKLDQLWEMVVSSPDDRRSAAGLIKLTVARCVALFRKVAWAGKDEELGRTQLEAVIGLVDSSLSKAVIAETIKKLVGARIVQGTSALYISPKLLHVKLWCDWWENFGHLVTDDWLKATLKGRMQEWFFEMFVYAEESKAASLIIARMLSPDGPLARLEHFSSPGNPKLFFALAQADSKAALRQLRTVLEQADEKTRLDFKEGRREVVHGLERLAIPAANFFDAAQCLLLLAEAENESWSNNATGVFLSLFTLGYGKVAASEVPPIEKIPYLQGLLHSSRAVRRRLALQAIEASLKPFMSRIDVGDRAGLRSLPERWKPKTYGELWESYAAHVELLADAYQRLDMPDRAVAAQGIIHNARTLLQIPPLATRVVELLRELSRDEGLLRSVIEAIVSSLHFDKTSLPSEIYERLEELRVDLTGRSLHDKLVRYVGLNLVEDKFDDNGSYREAPRPEIMSLSDEVLMEPQLLEPELPWLVTNDAKNGFQFGALIGKADKSLKLWKRVAAVWHSARKNRSDFFVGGYLAGIFERDAEMWERVVLDLLASDEPAPDLLSLVWRSGMTDAIAWKLLKLCDEEKLAPKAFRLFVYGGGVAKLPLSLIKELVERLLGSGSKEDADSALDILQARQRVSPADNHELLDFFSATLGHSTFVRGTGVGEQPSDDMREYHWTEGAKALLRMAPERAMRLAVECIDNFGHAGSITEPFYGSAGEFLNEALKEHPLEMWAAIANRLSGDIDSDVYRMLQWLRGQSGHRNGTNPAFDLVPSSIVVEWVKEAPDTRAWLIAEYCPPVLSSGDEEPSLARMMLEYFGEREDVRNALHANFWTGIFAGPASEHYRGKLDFAKARLEEETSATVKIWLREEIKSLEHAVKVELEREEIED